MWEIIGSVGVPLTVGTGVIAAAIYATMAQHKPILAFELGDYPLSLSMRAFRHHIPGLDSEWVSENFAEYSDELEVLAFDGQYAKLVNYGSGSALDVAIQWFPRFVYYGSDRYDVQNSGLTNPKFGIKANTMLATQANIKPGAEAALSQIPTFLILSNAGLTRIEAEVHVTCRGSLKRVYTHVQGVHISREERDANHAKYVVSFKPIP